MSESGTPKPTSPPPKPGSTNIVLEREADALTIYLPPHGFKHNARFMVVFALFWNGFMSLFTAIVVASGGLRDAPVVLPLFLIGFWAIGLGLLYGALFQMFGKTLIRIDRSSLYLKRRLFGSGVIRQYDLTDDPTAQLATAYEQNDRPVHACAVETATKQVKFGTALAGAEKQWLVSEINGFFGAEPPPPEEPEHGMVERHVDGSRERPAEVSVELERLAGESFSVRFPPLIRYTLVKVAFTVGASALLVMLGFLTSFVWREFVSKPPIASQSERTIALVLMLFTCVLGVILFGSVCLLFRIAWGRAELRLTRAECRVRSVLPFGIASRTVPVEQVEEAFMQGAVSRTGSKKSVLYFGVLRLREGRPIYITAYVPAAEMEWVIAEVNGVLGSFQGM